MNNITKNIMSNKEVLAYFKTEENFNDYLNLITKKLKNVCNNFYESFPTDVIEPMYYIVSLNPNETYEKNNVDNIELAVLNIPEAIHELPIESREKIINIVIGSHIMQEERYNENNKVLSVIFQAEGQILKKDIDDNSEVNMNDPNFVDSVIISFFTLFGVSLKTYDVTTKNNKKHLKSKLSEDYNNYNFKSKSYNKKHTNYLINAVNTINKKFNDEDDDNSNEKDIFADDVNL